jgi:hypothetical protein
MRVCEKSFNLNSALVKLTWSLFADVTNCYFCEIQKLSVITMIHSIEQQIAVI